MVTTSDKGADVVLDFGQFSGEPKHFLNKQGEGFKTKVTGVLSSPTFEKDYIVQTAQALFTAFVPIIDQEASGEPSEHVCQGRTAGFEDYELIFTDEFMQATLQEAGVDTEFELSRLTTLKSKLGKDWADYKALRTTEQKLQDMHDRIILNDLQHFNIGFIKALRSSFASKNPNKDQKWWLRFLNSPEYSRIVLGHDATKDWIVKPWLIPAVKIFVQMLAYYDPKAEASSSNFLDDLLKTLSSVTSKGEDRRSVFTAITEFENVWREAADSFQDKEALADWMVTLFRMKVFREAAADLSSDEATAWTKADELMTARSIRGVRPKLEDTEAAIAEAQKFLKRPTQQGADSASLTLEQELQSLRAEVSDLRKAAASGSQRPQASRQQQSLTNPEDAKKPCKFCQEHGFQPSVHSMKHGCRREQEHNLAEMDKLRDKRQKNTAKKLKKQANTIIELDSNKALDDYLSVSASLIPWSKLSSSDLEIVSGDTVLGLQGLEASALLDSGSQAHVTPRLRQVLQKYPKQVRLGGVSGQSTQAQSACVGLPICIDGDMHLLRLNKGALYASEARQTILSLALLMKAGFKPHLSVGTAADPHFGGTLESPDGKRIVLHFERDLWHLPLWTKPVKSAAVQKSQSVSATVTSNPYSLLTGLDGSESSQPVSRPSVSVKPLKQVTWSDSVQTADVTSSVFSHLPADLTPHQRMQVLHDAWCHPSASKFQQIYKKHGPKGFPQGFASMLKKFSCQSCAVCKSARSYRHTAKFKQQVVHHDSSKLDSTRPSLGETTSGENPQQGAMEYACDDNVDPIEPSSKQDDPDCDLQLPDLADGISFGDVNDLELHIDYAHAIAIGYNGEKYYLIMVLGRQVFLWASATKKRQSPEELIQEFVDATGIKLSAVRFDEAAEFATSSSFKAWIKQHGAVMRPVPAYSHTLNSRAEGAIRITKDHVRCMLKSSNLPRKFWPYALLQFMRMYNHWPGPDNKTGWERLSSSKLCNDVSRDAISFGSLCVGHLPREHPLVKEDTTHADRGLEGAFLMWDLFTPTIWMYSFRLKKIVRLDPKHFRPHLYPFRDPSCLANTDHFTIEDIRRMHSADDSLSAPPSRPRRSAFSDKGETTQAEQPFESLPENAEHKIKQDQLGLRPKEKVAGLGRGSKIEATNGAQVPLDADIKNLSDAQLARALAHHKFVFKLPQDYWNNPYTGATSECTVMARRAQGIKKRQYLWCDVLEPKQAHNEGHEIQLRVSEDSKSSDSHLNLRNALNTVFDYPKTLADIGLTSNTVQDALQAMISLYARQSPKVSNKEKEMKNHKGKFIKNMVGAMTLGFALSGGTWNTPPPSDMLEDLHPFIDDNMNQVWVSMLKEDEDQASAAEDDMLELDPSNRKAAMKHPRFAPFWLDGEREEMSGLWARNCFRKVKRKDLLPNDRVFSSRFHYHIKRDAATGKIIRFKVRLVIQGHRMQASTDDKVGDYESSFAPVPHATVGRMIMAIAVAEDEECDAIDLTQAFIQADRLDEGVNGRWFMTPPPGSEEEDPDVVYEVLRPLYGIPSSARALNVTLDNWLKSEGFQTVGFEDSVWVRPAGGKYGARIILSAHIDDNLISCKSRKVLNHFKKEFLTRFDGTDEGPVTQYLGCEFIRDRKKRTGELRQSAYAQKVLRKFEMWDCTTVKTPLEPGYRLTKQDCPEVVDADLQRRYRALTGSVGFLVSMTRPDLAFAYNELSKFVQYPGEKHWECGRRVLQYLRGTYDRGIKWHDPGSGKRHNLLAYVDSDFAACKDTRRSQTGYLVTMNGGPVSWRAKRQSSVTLSSAEAEFVAASLCGVEILYTRELMKGFGLEQKKPTILLEDNESCRLMASNPVNRERSRHIDTRVHWLRELVKNKILKVVKVKGTENPSDALTKSVPAPTLEKHREYLMGTRVPFQVFYGQVASAA